MNATTLILCFPVFNLTVRLEISEEPHLASSSRLHKYLFSVMFFHLACFCTHFFSLQRFLPLSSAKWKPRSSMQNQQSVFSCTFLDL